MNFARHLFIPSYLSIRLIAAWSIPFEPEELLRGGERIGVRTRRGGTFVNGPATAGADCKLKPAQVRPTQEFSCIQSRKALGRMIGMPKGVSRANKSRS